uniref:Uncharacterized protein n=1 Tax=Arundo donax TaxID=35708 RepID=A0A0A9HKA3_ARUDO
MASLGCNNCCQLLACLLLSRWRRPWSLFLWTFRSVMRSLCSKQGLLGGWSSLC